MNNTNNNYNNNNKGMYELNRGTYRDSRMYQNHQLHTTADPFVNPFMNTPNMQIYPGINPIHGYTPGVVRNPSGSIYGTETPVMHNANTSLLTKIDNGENWNNNLTSTQHIIDANLTFKNMRVYDFFEITSGNIDVDPVKITIKKINKCILERNPDNRYKVVETDMELESEDMEITERMKKVILENLYYDPVRNMFVCYASLYILYLLAGNSEQKKLVVSDMLKGKLVVSDMLKAGDIYEDIEVLDVIKTKVKKDDPGCKTVELTIRIKLFNKLETDITLKIDILSNSITYLRIKTNDNEGYPISEIYRVILKKLIVGNRG